MKHWFLITTQFVFSSFSKKNTHILFDEEKEEETEEEEEEEEEKEEEEQVYWRTIYKFARQMNISKWVIIYGQQHTV